MYLNKPMLSMVREMCIKVMENENIREDFEEQAEQLANVADHEFVQASFLLKLINLDDGEE